MVSPNPLSPIPSTYSAIKTPDLQSPHPSASLVKTEETPEEIKKDPDAPEQSWCRYSNGVLLWLVVQPNYRSSNKKLTVRTLVSIQYLSGPVDTRLQVLYYTKKKGDHSLKFLPCLAINYISPPASFHRGILNKTTKALFGHVSAFIAESQNFYCIRHLTASDAKQYGWKVWKLWAVVQNFIKHVQMKWRWSLFHWHSTGSEMEAMLGR